MGKLTYGRFDPRREQATFISPIGFKISHKRSEGIQELTRKTGIGPNTAKVLSHQKEVN